MGGGGHHDIHARICGRGAIIGDCLAAGHARGERSCPLRYGIATNRQARARQRPGPLPSDRSTADDGYPHALPVLTHFRCAGVTQIETSHYSSLRRRAVALKVRELPVKSYRAACRAYST